MVPFDAWTKSKNKIKVYDPTFADSADSFDFLFVQRGTCLTATIPVDSVTECEGRISFNFTLDCELSQGTHEVTLINTTKTTIVFSDCVCNVYDTPSECVKNEL